MAEETGEYVNEISKLAARIRIGYGEAAGQFLSSGILEVPPRGFQRAGRPPTNTASRSRSISRSARTSRTCILPRMEPAWGWPRTTIFVCSALCERNAPRRHLSELGCAVLLPEVFLKGVSVVRNLGVPLRPITTANFDFMQHYRALQNVVKRPTASPRGSRGLESHGYAITGHHDLCCRWWPRPWPPLA